MRHIFDEYKFFRQVWGEGISRYSREVLMPGGVYIHEVQGNTPVLANSATLQGGGRDYQCNMVGDRDVFVWMILFYEIHSCIEEKMELHLD